MKVGAPKETFPSETRVAMTPASVGDLLKLGHGCLIEAGAGTAAGYTDDEYKKAGATVVEDARSVYDGSDIIIKVRPPSSVEIQNLTIDKTLVSFFYPAQNETLLGEARLSLWIWCHVSAERKKWTHSHRWQT